MKSLRFFALFALLWTGVQIARAQPSRQQETPSVLLPGSYWDAERAPLQVGASAPNWVLPLAPDSPLAKSGVKDLDFARFRGEKVSVLIFWAFWCDTWRDATQFLGALRPELQKRGVKLVVVAVDASQQPVARPAWKSGKLWFPIAIDGKGEVVARYGVRRVPTILVVEPKGRVRAMWEGLPGKKAFLKAVSE